MLTQSSDSRLRSQKTCFTKSPIFRKLLFPKVFCTWPTLPLYLCPREYCPLIHLHVTSLSPHSCAAGASSRVWMVASAVPGPLLSSRYLLSYPFFFLCTMGSFTLSRANVTNLHLSASVLFTSLSLTQSSLLVQSVAILSQTFPRLCHLHLCFHLV